MRINKPSSNKGFTLIELLVALVIFAILSALSYRSLSALLQTKERIEIETERWREVMLFFNRLDMDLNQAVDRPVTIDKTVQAAWIGKTSYIGNNDAQLIFSRSGSSDQGGLLMDTQRIGYRYKAGNIELLIWPALDVDSITNPTIYNVLSGVSSMSVKYMQPKTYAWKDTWPIILSNGRSSTDVIPKAVSVDITLQSGEKLNRVYNLP